MVIRCLGYPIDFLWFFVCSLFVLITNCWYSWESSWQVQGSAQKSEAAINHTTFEVSVRVCVGVLSYGFLVSVILCMYNCMALIEQTFYAFPLSHTWVNTYSSFLWGILILQSLQHIFDQGKMKHSNIQKLQKFLRLKWLHNNNLSCYRVVFMMRERIQPVEKSSLCYNAAV